MTTDIFFQKVNTYTHLNPASHDALADILSENKYNKGDYFLSVGQTPRKVAFVSRGLFSQYYLTEDGDKVIKYFFPEGRIAGSIPATLTQSKSPFAIEALEQTIVLEYDYQKFKKLVSTYRDIADFYISYLEKHWVIEKEPFEISYRHDTADTRYDKFCEDYPELTKRLKKHQIASYLGITPTQLSRILPENK